MTDVSIIIVSYNTYALTLECIRSVYKHTAGCSFEVIVVDNASADDTVRRIKEEFPSVAVIENNVNMGFATANNRAAKIACGKYLFMLNSDTVLFGDSVKVLYDFYENAAESMRIRGEKLGAAGGVLLNQDMTNGWSGGGFNEVADVIGWYYSRMVPRGRQRFNAAAGLDLGEGSSLPVDYVSGADMFIPAKLFEECGGFDEEMFLYYEDEELQWRLKKSGYTNMLVGGTRIIHLGGGSREKTGKLMVPARLRLHIERSMFHYWRKTRGDFYGGLAKAVYFIMAALPLRFFYGWKENILYLKEFFKM